MDPPMGRSRAAGCWSTSFHVASEDNMRARVPWGSLCWLATQGLVVPGPRHTPRVDAVQHALVSFTGVPVGDQILMCHGARLDPAKPLSAYKLPVVRAASHARALRHARERDERVRACRPARLYAAAFAALGPDGPPACVLQSQLAVSGRSVAVGRSRATHPARSRTPLWRRTTRCSSTTRHSCAPAPSRRRRTLCRSLKCRVRPPQR